MICKVICLKSHRETERRRDNLNFCDGMLAQNRWSLANNVSIRANSVAQQHIGTIY